MTHPDLVARARELATTAHHGQVDKAGTAYIGHPARVASGARALVQRRHQDNPALAANAEIVGWLHDVVEDTGVTLAQVRDEFGATIAAAVDAMTRRAGETPDGYYDRVARDPVALIVKEADLADNTDPHRLAHLDEATRARLVDKYAHAAEALGITG